MDQKGEKKPTIDKENEDKKAEKATTSAVEKKPKAEKRPPKEGSDDTKVANMECSSPPKSKEGSASIGSSSCRDWLEMPIDVLGDIMKALPYIDQCRFRAVCHQWNEAASLIMRKCRMDRSGASSNGLNVKKKKKKEVDVANLHIDYQPYGEHPRSPWLMIPVRNGKGTHHGFCSLVEEEVEATSSTSSNYFFRLNHLPSIGHIVGTSPGGWILYVDGYGELHALNIFTLVEIDAPPLSTFSGLFEIHRDEQGQVTSYTSTNMQDPHGGVINYKIDMSYYSQALIFFFPPPNLTTTNNNSSYCCPENKKDNMGGSRVRKGRYLFVVIRGVYMHLAYAWEGDQSWTDVDPQNKIYNFCNLIMHNGLIYAVAIKCPSVPDHNFGFVATFDPIVGFESFKILDAPFYHTRTSTPNGPFELLLNSYIVEISSELWVVNRDLLSIYNKERRMQRGRNGRRGCIHTDMCYLFKLDKEANQWIEIHDGFGEGLALFLGTNQSLVHSTSQFPHLKSNCIYFTDNAWDFYHLPSFDRGIGVFNLKTKTFNFDFHWRPNGNNFPAAVWLLR